MTPEQQTEQIRKEIHAIRKAEERTAAAMERIAAVLGAILDVLEAPELPPLDSELEDPLDPDGGG